jgi:hypothetical protein
LAAIELIGKWVEATTPRGRWRFMRAAQRAGPEVVALADEMLREYRDPSKGDRRKSK